ncbi:DUF6912 family protein [Brachybacterium hainanense]|uniref:DUF6912 family protein n=1 Tax=Brachybacterium hainanense TaxID=1541174 RepID=A0ABV6RBY4_9MICO
MRIFLPVADTEHALLRSGAARLALEPGRTAWAVTASARADRPREDLEDLEYDALQDAVYAALQTGSDDDDPHRRALVVAGDTEDAALAEAGEEAGAYGVVTTAATGLRIASLHVTELGARAVEQDDTDPALLWFDVSEGPRALAYLHGGPEA